MEQKPKALVSKAESTRLYRLYKEGKISYSDLMGKVHATPDMAKLPDRVKEKVDKKTGLAIKGLI